MFTTSFQSVTVQARTEISFSNSRELSVDQKNAFINQGTDVINAAVQTSLADALGLHVDSNARDASTGQALANLILNATGHEARELVGGFVRDMQNASDKLKSAVQDVMHAAAHAVPCHQQTRAIAHAARHVEDVVSKRLDRTKDVSNHAENHVKSSNGGGCNPFQFIAKLFSAVVKMVMKVVDSVLQQIPIIGSLVSKLMHKVVDGVLNKIENVAKQLDQSIGGGTAHPPKHDKPKKPDVTISPIERNPILFPFPDVTISPVERGGMAII